eukprot:TRINITY_DN4143_c0_g2_i1.p1 TRINITY_DN4143_c0_g2~~TRINITY_DN4143_c0_g2_i1.p1  ORF type:complete len:313 (+),score=78.60 TRINITY_DN4143_c0_g2_i1:55-993(+)
MRITIKYPEAGTEGTIEEHDELLGKNSTVLDLKGLIKLWTGESIMKQVLLMDDNVCEDRDTLQSLGISTQEDAEQKPFSLILEEEEEAAMAEGEYTHEAFIRANTALGKGVAVTPDTEHEEQKRREITQRAIEKTRKEKEHPRVRPMKLNTHSPEMSTEDKSDVYAIYLDSKYGMRVKGMDQKLMITVGAEDYEYWDLRLPETLSVRTECNRATEVVLDVFYFGEIKKVVSQEAFRQKVKDKLEGLGIKTSFLSYPLRDAGCMYPLIAMPFVVSHSDAEKLGHSVFEHFGRPMTPPSQRPLNSGAGGGCGSQ